MQDSNFFPTILGKEKRRGRCVGNQDVSRTLSLVVPIAAMETANVGLHH
jgi:hypothetical protein